MKMTRRVVLKALCAVPFIGIAPALAKELKMPKGYEGRKERENPETVDELLLAMNRSMLAPSVGEVSPMCYTPMHYSLGVMLTDKIDKTKAEALLCKSAWQTFLLHKGRCPANEVLHWGRLPKLFLDDEFGAIQAKVVLRFRCAIG